MAPAMRAIVRRFEPASTRSTVLDPLQHADYFGIGKILSMRELFDARVHLGHKEGLLNDFMKPYLFGSRLGYLVIDLEKTFDHLFPRTQLCGTHCLQGWHHLICHQAPAG
ncbi:hypothetical protein HPB50_007998 [Hyalomma asiaticum]|uniref:Uncharacterized protein n=1 Tax=Hyalomma asiaticum TaxID=266040 RepID=A0ACB7RUX5_HYAAI|nr:hypothetical protein HPB50_007998 [Hyalomma asiaticum]